MSNRLRKHAKRHESGGLDEIDLTGLSGVLPDAGYPNAVLIDGSRSMTDSLTISGALKELIFDSGRIKEDATDDWLQIQNKAGDDFGNLRINQLQMYDIFWFNSAGEIIGSTAADDVLLRTYTAFPPVKTTVATMEGGPPAFSIQKAGDITFNAGKKLLNADHIELDEITTPTAVADHGKIYTKTDNKLYFQDGAGTEHEIAFV